MAQPFEYVRGMCKRYRPVTRFVAVPAAATFVIIVGIGLDCKYTLSKIKCIVTAPHACMRTR